MSHMVARGLILMILIFQYFFTGGQVVLINSDISERRSNVMNAVVKQQNILSSNIRCVFL